MTEVELPILIHALPMTLLLVVVGKFPKTLTHSRLFISQDAMGDKNPLNARSMNASDDVQALLLLFGRSQQPVRVTWNSIQYPNEIY